MNDRGYVGQPYAAVLLSNLDAFVPVAFYAQLAIVGIGDADDQECLLAADFRVDEPVGPLSHTAACLQGIVQEIAQDDAQVHVLKRQFRRHHNVGCQRNAAGSGLLLGIVDQDVDHAVSAGEGHLHAVGGVIDLFNVCKGLLILACF